MRFLIHTPANENFIIIHSLFRILSTYHAQTSDLARQKNDSFVRERLEKNYVSRSAFKLIQLNNSYRFLKKAKTVVDLGASPGGWTQVALEKMGNKQSRVFALDLLDLDNQVKMSSGGSERLSFIKGDFTASMVQDELHTSVQGSDTTIDVVLSDMMGKYCKVCTINCRCRTELFYLCH